MVQTLNKQDNPEKKYQDSDKDDKCSGQGTHRGKLITDATACPQDIAYPTDLNILNDARDKSEQLIDELLQYYTHSYLT